MKKTGLVLEGGGMRGIFTAGVLDYFLEQGLLFDNCIAVSAGACHACSYLAGQRGRALAVSTDYLTDKRYCSTYSLLTTGDLFGVKFSYHKIPEELYPIDNVAFRAGKTVFQTVVTNCVTGEAEYPQVRDLARDIDLVRASSSLPFVSRMVTIGDGKYLDGGMADSIPIRQSFAQGNTKHVVILTQPRDYRKQETPHRRLMKLRYRNYPKLIEKMQTRHLMYNETLDFLYEKERAGEVFVLAPTEVLGIERIERNPEMLRKVYQIGYEAAKHEFDTLTAYLNA